MYVCVCAQEWFNIWAPWVTRSIPTHIHALTLSRQRARSCSLLSGSDLYSREVATAKSQFHQLFVSLQSSPCKLNKNLKTWQAQLLRGVSADDISNSNTLTFRPAVEISTNPSGHQRQGWKSNWKGNSPECTRQDQFTSREEYYRVPLSMWKQLYDVPCVSGGALSSLSWVFRVILALRWQNYNREPVLKAGSLKDIYLAGWV